MIILWAFEADNESGAHVTVAVYELPVIYSPTVCQLWSQVCSNLKRLSNICSGCFESKIEKASKAIRETRGNFE